MAKPVGRDTRPELLRRSRRIQKRIPIVVRSQAREKQLLPEKTDALIVNAHGGLILLGLAVKENEFVIVENPKTGDELLCRVTHIGAHFMGKSEVGIEFIKPSPLFWGITPPPDDWDPSGKVKSTDKGLRLSTAK